MRAIARLARGLLPLLLAACDGDGGAPTPVASSLPELTVLGGSFKEGAASGGGVQPLFGFVLSAPAPTEIRLDYQTRDGTALAGRDYEARSGTLVIPAGATTAGLGVPVLGDDEQEADETFSLQLSNVRGASLAQTSALATLLDDDGPLTAEQGNSLSVTVIGGGRVVSLPAGIDCGSDCSEVYAPGSLVSLQASGLAGDDLFTGWSGACSGSAACVLSLDDARSVTATFIKVEVPGLSIYPAEPMREGEVAGAQQRFELRLTRPSSRELTVDYQSLDDSAQAGSDYLPVRGSLRMPAGQRRAFIAVPLVNDAVAEADETYRIQLANPQGVLIETASATGRIVNDDLVSGCNPSQRLCAGAAQGLLRIPVGVPLGGYLRPPAGGEYVPAAEAFSEGDPSPFFNTFLAYIPTTSEGGAPNAPAPNEAKKSPYSTYSPSSRGYRDSLITKAVALSHGDETVVFVKNDVIGMIDEFGVAVTARVKARTGVDLGNGLIMSATHTHDGPGAIGNTSLKYFWLAIDAYHPDLFDRVVSDVSDVVVQALANRVPARFGFASGSSGDGLNSFRRTRSIYDGQPGRSALQDDLRKRIGVFRVDQVEPDGRFLRPLAIMVNYAAHGIMHDVENLYFSGDCLGGLERSIESRFDTPVMAMQVQGAGGDVSPRADGDPTRQRIERFGELLAPKVLALWDSVANFSQAPPIRVLDQRVILSLDKLGYTNNEYPYQYGAAQCNNSIEPPFVGGPSAGQAEACVAMPAPGAQDLQDNGVGENDAWVPQDTRLAVAQVGDAVMLMQPGEPLAEQGLRLLEAAAAIDATRFASERVFIWGYALDHVGYILPDLKDDWLLGGTEGTTTFWGWKQGGRFLASTQGLLLALRDGAAEPADEFALNYTDPLPRTPPQASVSPRAGVVLTQPASIRRFETATLLFEGGDPIIDLPTITLEVETGGVWMPARRPNGEVLDDLYEFWLDYALTSGSHGWTVRFEPAKDFPAGRYRFRVSGQALLGPGPSPYSLNTDPFEVLESNTLQLTGLRRVDAATVEATLSYAPLPDNYRLLDPAGNTSNPAPVRRGRVRFTSGGQSVEALAPLDAGAGSAVYRAALADGGSLSAAGQDVWGNRTPD